MSTTRQHLYAGTKEVESHLQLDLTRLEPFLQKNVPDYHGPLSLKRFKGGQSNPTYQLVTPGRSYVLRRKPPGPLLPSAHAVDREYRVIKALHAVGFPVPRPFVLCEDVSVIGTMFYVMEMVEGRVLWELALPEQTPAERSAIYESMISTLAQLQQLDYQKLGLSDFGKPTDYFARQITRWAKTYVSSQTAQIPLMDRLNAWLPAHVPPSDETTLVHGDYRMDNMIMHPTEPRVIAVLDWELSTLGHPLGDFTYHTLPWLLPSSTGEKIGNLAGLDLPSLGIPTLDQYIARYCALSGRPEIPHLEFYSAYTVWRLACILQGIIKRVEDGTAANSETPWSVALVEELASAAWRFATKAGAK